MGQVLTTFPEATKLELFHQFLPLALVVPATAWMVPTIWFELPGYSNCMLIYMVVLILALFAHETRPFRREQAHGEHAMARRKPASAGAGEAARDSGAASKATKPATQAKKKN
ncbi:unnamed protein product [Pedinophyceae sp. YPF-701]|nr:unnamed protein product [Pedinophyceae sp. YPF-701]